MTNMRYALPPIHSPPNSCKLHYEYKLASTSVSLGLYCHNLHANIAVSAKYGVNNDFWNYMAQLVLLHIALGKFNMQFLKAFEHFIKRSLRKFCYFT